MNGQSKRWKREEAGWKSVCDGWDQEGGREGGREEGREGGSRTNATSSRSVLPIEDVP